MNNKCCPFTLGNLINNMRSDIGAIYMSVIEVSTKRAAEAYISTEKSKERIWNHFTQEAMIDHIEFIDCVIPAMRIFVNENNDFNIYYCQGKEKGERVMAKAKITAGFDNDFLGNSVVRVKKSRGKLTLDEIEDVLRHTANGVFQGHYIMIVNASEAACEGGNYWMVEEPVGDMVDLYAVSQGERCPVCNKYVPPFDYCPHCGESWKEEGRE